MRLICSVARIAGGKMYPEIRLKAGKEGNALFRHPWIFSGALEKTPDNLPNGSLVTVTDSRGKIIATGTYSAKSLIAVRIFEFGPAIINSDWIRRKIAAAQSLRLIHGYGPSKDTTGYRILFGEADGFPGLAIDRYEDVLVMQLSIAGLENLRDMIIEVLIDAFKPRSIVERSDLPVRKEEGLEEVAALRYGEEPGLVEFLENGLIYIVDVVNGQKTGFYLDQKDLRREIMRISRGRKVLNLFSYSGATGLAAMKGSAQSVHNVDSSASALGLARLIGERNGINQGLFTDECADVFAWLSHRAPPSYDLVILDPPALIKSQNDFESGRKAYHFLNRAALRLINDDGLLVTSSCSAFFNEADLSYTLRRASVQTCVRLDLLKIVRQSPDHPISIYFPESAYLKTFICRVGR
jgi:23S rRNA (cytosine1962-C5)-methyltransferase